MNAQTLHVLIIGCGNIAGIFDQSRSPDELPLTHAGAFSRDQRFTIDACVEPDDHRRKEFMDAWGIPEGFRTIDELTKKGQEFDIISICSPTKNHKHDLEKSISLNPKLIFCEKPVTLLFSETQGLVKECHKANILFAVNYTRRWDPDIRELQADIQAGHRGELRSMIGTYNKGILNNGSHMLDLLHILVGPVEVIKVGRALHDYFSDDPSIPVWLEAEQGLPIQLACGDAGDYAHFELQLIFATGVLAMEEGGMFWRERIAVDNDSFIGYRKLDEGERRAGRYPQSMLNALDNIYNAIYQQEPLASTGETALAAQCLSEQIINLAYKSQ